jgi:hypothetical protein
MSFYPTLEEKLKKDTAYLVNIIINHPEKKAMIQVLTKGPPKDLGYMWGLDHPTYWTEEERKAINLMHVWVLQKDWESSGYAIMFRSLEKAIKKYVLNTFFEKAEAALEDAAKKADAEGTDWAEV